MKIIRINKGKTIPLPFRLTGVLLVILLTVKIVDWLTEPLSIIVIIIISTFLPALWFATNIIIINEENKTLFDGVWTMGKKLGNPIKYDAIEKIFINRVKTKQTMYSLSNRQNVVTDHEYRAYLKLTNGDKYFLISHPLQDRMEEKVAKIKTKLEIN